MGQLDSDLPRMKLKEVPNRNFRRMKNILAHRPQVAQRVYRLLDRILRYAKLHLLDFASHRGNRPARLLREAVPPHHFPRRRSPSH